MYMLILDNVIFVSFACAIYCIYVVYYMCVCHMTVQGDWVDDERSGEGEFTYNTGDVYSGKWSEDKQSKYALSNRPFSKIESKLGGGWAD